MPPFQTPRVSLPAPAGRDGRRESTLCSGCAAGKRPAFPQKQLSPLGPEISYASLCPTLQVSLPALSRSPLRLPCPPGRRRPFPSALDPCRSGAERDLRGHPSSPPGPACPVLRLVSSRGTDLRLRETNACCSPRSLLCPCSAMATYSATCANTGPAQGVHMANSIADLRLKAKEYSLQRNQVPTVN